METAILVLLVANIAVSCATLVIIAYSKAETVIKPLAPSGIVVKRKGTRMKPVFNDDQKAALLEQKQAEQNRPMV